MAGAGSYGQTKSKIEKGSRHGLPGTCKGTTCLPSMRGSQLSAQSAAGSGGSAGWSSAAKIKNAQLGLLFPDDRLHEELSNFVETFQEPNRR